MKIPACNKFKFGFRLSTGLISLLLISATALLPSTLALADEWGPRTPSVRLSPAKGSVGTNVYVGIIDFPKMAKFQITFGSLDNLIGTVTTDTTGYAITSFSITEMPAGQYIVRVTDGTTERSAAFQIEPVCSTSSSSVQVNDAITVSGSCFAGNQKATLYFDERNVGAGTTDHLGNLQIKAPVPSSHGGTHTLKIIDGAGYSAATQVNVLPSASISPNSGPVGTEVKIEAHGFSQSSDLIMSTGQTRLAILPASGNGYYRTNLRIPAMPGAIDIIISDDKNAITLPFKVASTLTLSSNSGGIPSFISLQGTGYKTGVPIIISFDDNKVGTVNSNAEGEFTFNLTIGKTTGGNHSVIATDGVNVQKAPFMVETIPPAAPKPAFPKDKDIVNGDVTLAWGKVTDPSGISYSFEVSRDTEFKDILVTRSGLAEQDYILTSERMNHASETWYYWRVKAVDGASNHGPWSETRSFHTTFNLPAFILGMPIWTKGGLGAILLAFVCFTCFWAGRMVSIRKTRPAMLQSSIDNLTSV
jgi:hypothetical protein